MAAKKAQRQTASACERLYSRQVMERMRQTVNGGDYFLHGQGTQHNVYLDGEAHRIVKIVRSTKEKLAAFRDLARRAGRPPDKGVETQMNRVMLKTMAAYVPAKELGGNYVWPTDLVTNVSLNVDGEIVSAPVAVVQRQFETRVDGRESKSVLSGGSRAEVREFLDDYLGAHYTLTRQGLYITDWANFENAVLPSREQYPQLATTVFIDPFIVMTDRALLAKNFRAILNCELAALSSDGFEYLTLFKQRLERFLGRFDPVANLGADRTSAERAPGCFDFVNS